MNRARLMARTMFRWPRAVTPRQLREDLPLASSSGASSTFFVVDEAGVFVVDLDDPRLGDGAGVRDVSDTGSWEGTFGFQRVWPTVGRERQALARYGQRATERGPV